MTDLDAALARHQNEIDLDHCVVCRGTGGPFPCDAARARDRIAELEVSAKEIEAIVYAVEGRCMAVDGPVSPTLAEITEDELQRLWRAAHKIAEGSHD